MACGVWRALLSIAYAAVAAGISVRSLNAPLHDDVPSTHRDTSDHQLSQTFEQLAGRLPEGPTKEMLSRLKVCGTCDHMQRFGSINDGGYVSCTDDWGQGKIRAAYSMGVCDDDQWAVDIYNTLNIPIHQFDCTVPAPPKNGNCPSCTFEKICLQAASGAGGYPGGPNMNIEQVLSLTNQTSAPDDSLLLKMDIEGAEWHIFSEVNSGLNKFGQIIIEFHWLNDKKGKIITGGHQMFAKALRNIEEAGFKVLHVHGNNNEAMAEFEGFSIPTLIEVTFVKNKPSLKVCEADQHLIPQDAVNIPDKPDLPMSHLPE